MAPSLKTKFIKAAPLALGTTLAFAISTDGLAQFEDDAVHEEGADAITRAITKALGDLATELPGEVNMVLQSAVDVALDENAYLATIPALSLRTEDDDGRYELQVEPTSSAIEPLGGNRLQAFVELPERVVGSKDDVPTFEVSWTTQIAELIFNSDFGFAEDADIELSDITITDLENNAIVGTSSGMTITGTYDGSATDSFDGEGAAVITDIEFFKPDDSDDVLSIGQIEIGSDIAQQNIAQYHAFSDFMADLQARGYNESPAPSAEARQLAKQFVTFLDSAEGGGAWAVMNDFFVSDDDFAVGFGVIGAAMSMDGFKQAESSIGVYTEIADSDLPVEGPYEVLVPSRGHIDIALAELPKGVVNYFFEQAFYAYLTRLEGNELGPLLSGATMNLLTSGAVLEIETSAVEFDDSAIFSEGQFRFDHTTPLMGVGEATVRLVGIENLIAKTRALPDGEAIAAFLAFIQLMGAEEEGADGLAIRRYDVEATAEGQILINGTDIGPIISQL